MKKLLYCSLWLLLYVPIYASAQNKPDLVPVAPFTVPNFVQAGNSYPMSSVVRNQGTNGSQFNCIGYYISADNVWDANDVYLGASCQALLFPGQSGTCAITANIPPQLNAGTYRLLLVADPLNAEQESDETNNVVGFGLTVGAGTTVLPDLELWRPSMSFSTLPAGGSTGSFTFIFNRGAGGVGAYEIGFYLSSDTVFSASTDVFMGLSAGSSLSANGGTVHSAPMLTVPRTTVPGNYYLLLMADPRNAVAESNENNNSRALPLLVTGPLATVAPTATIKAEVYPNPVSSSAPLWLYTEGLSKGTLATLYLYDAVGRQIASQQQFALSNQPAAVRVSQHLQPGMYTLRIATAEGNVTRRLVVK